MAKLDSIIKLKGDIMLSTFFVIPAECRLFTSNYCGYEFRIQYFTSILKHVCVFKGL